ncbi:DNA-binding protein [Vibrio lamellibrachiae]|uniref:baseplate complex protein n=1 Tax=Vibrio lamellibrachiae TaxID=2910253 RepID=UPI003D0F8521
MLSLDGEIIPLKNLKVGCTKEFKSKDMSGQASSTDSSEQGDKGVKINVSGILAFRDEEWLSTLSDMSSQKDDNGNRKVFRIGNRDTRLYKVREVKFDGSLKSNEHDSLLAWVISFSLREYSSAAEQKQIRENQQSQPQQSENTAHKQALKDAEEVLQ